jgi:hypothetical protein
LKKKGEKIKVGGNDRVLSGEFIEFIGLLGSIGFVEGRSS